MANLNRDNINQTRTILENAKSILIVLGQNPSYDAVASALSFYLSLSAAGKQISVVSPTEMTVGYNELIAVDKIGKTIGSDNGRNLIISFPYQEGSIEKVSYNIENDTFNLVIEPRDGFPAITSEMMNYSFGNGDYDVIITLSCSNPNELGQILGKNQNLLRGKNIINIDTDNKNSLFGKINLIDSTVSSISEIILGLLDQLGLPIEPDMATNLLTGITANTENFSSQKTTAGTFEAAAMLLKYGGRKSQFEAINPISTPQFSRQVNKQDRFGQKGLTPTFENNRSIPFGRQPGKFQPGQATDISAKPGVPQQQTPFPGNLPQQQHPSLNEVSKPPETPPDWLKPKIYKGSTLL